MKNFQIGDRVIMTSPLLGGGHPNKGYVGTIESTDGSFWVVKFDKSVGSESCLSSELDHFSPLTTLMYAKMKNDGLLFKKGTQVRVMSDMTEHGRILVECGMLSEWEHVRDIDLPDSQVFLDTPAPGQEKHKYAVAFIHKSILHLDVVEATDENKALAIAMQAIITDCKVVRI